MYPPDEDKTAFTIGREIFCYKVMPFGLNYAEAKPPSSGWSTV